MKPSALVVARYLPSAQYEVYLRHDRVDCLSTRSMSTARTRPLLCSFASIPCSALLLVHQPSILVPSLTAGLIRFFSALDPPRMQNGGLHYIGIAG